jgi:hypothetical protein
MFHSVSACHTSLKCFLPAATGSKEEEQRQAEGQTAEIEGMCRMYLHRLKDI